jgi:hypothetical protein
MEYECVITALTVKPKTEPIYSEYATTITMEDEGAGPFVCVKQEMGKENKELLRIDAEEWPTMRGAIDHIFSLINGKVL